MGTSRDRLELMRNIRLHNLKENKETKLDLDKAREEDPLTKVALDLGTRENPDIIARSEDENVTLVKEHDSYEELDEKLGPAHEERTPRELPKVGEKFMTTAGPLTVTKVDSETGDEPWISYRYENEPEKEFEKNLFGFRTRTWKEEGDVMMQELGPQEEPPFKEEGIEEKLGPDHGMEEEHTMPDYTRIIDNMEMIMGLMKNMLKTDEYSVRSVEGLVDAFLEKHPDIFADLKHELKGNDEALMLVQDAADMLWEDLTEPELGYRDEFIDLKPSLKPGEMEEGTPRQETWKKSAERKKEALTELGPQEEPPMTENKKYLANKKKPVIKEYIDRPEDYPEMDEWLWHQTPDVRRKLDFYEMRGKTEDAAMWLKKTFSEAMKFWDIEDLDEYLGKAWDLEPETGELRENKKSPLSNLDKILKECK